MGKIKFGTDGWRAVISEDFTFENVGIVAQAVADFVKSQKSSIYRKKKMVIGYDTRFLSDKYAEIMACVLAANGIKVVLTDRPSPTPAVCVYIKDKKLTGGLMITASHNPPYYNGIKYKGFFGGSAGNNIIVAIEKRLHKSRVKSIKFSEGLKNKMIVTEDIERTQIRYIKKYADMKLLKKSKLKVLIDSMNGTGETYIGEILKGCKNIKVEYMYTDVNPGFHGRAPEPNDKHLQELIGKMKKGNYDLGVATDGDADRLAIVDEKGNILTGHQLMALLILHLYEDRGMTGGVVQTICGTGLIDKICKKYGLKMYETAVGFKYICEMMTKKDILCGGEETGGIGFKDYIPERDGFLSALLIMEMLAVRKKSLSQILKDVAKEYGKYVYLRDDLVFPESKRKKLIDGIEKKPLEKIIDRPVVRMKDYDGTKFICDDGSWLLVRLSGTEPKLRIYCETSSKKKSQEFMEYGKKYALGILKK